MNLSFSKEDIPASGTAIHFGLKTQVRLSKPIKDLPEPPTEIPESVEIPAPNSLLTVLLTNPIPLPTNDIFPVAILC